MKKKYTFTLISLVIACIIFYVLANLKYSVLDITADNFKDGILGPYYQGNEGSLWETGIDNCISDKISLLNSNNYQNCNSYYQIQRNENEKGLSIIISNNQNKLEYKTFFNKKNQITSIIINSFGNYFQVKKIVENLIIKEGFTLKKTNLKNGFDIIIKETNDSFIIGYLVEEYEPTPPSAIFISSFSKRKYFRFLD